MFENYFRCCTILKLSNVEQALTGGNCTLSQCYNNNACIRFHLEKNTLYIYLNFYISPIRLISHWNLCVPWSSDQLLSKCLYAGHNSRQEWKALGKANIWKAVGLNWTLYCQYLKDISISKFEWILKRHHTIAMAQPEKFHICCGVGVQLSYFSRHMDWLSIRLPRGGLRNISRLGKSHPPPTKTVKLTFVEVIRKEFQIQLGSVLYWSTSGVAFGQGFVKQIQLFWLPQDCLDCLSLFTRSERRTMGRHQSA